MICHPFFGHYFVHGTLLVQTQVLKFNFFNSTESQFDMYAICELWPTQQWQPWKSFEMADGVADISHHFVRFFAIIINQYEGKKLKEV